MGFADDIALLCDSKEDLEVILREYERIEKFNLKVNKKKSAILSNDPRVKDFSAI